MLLSVYMPHSGHDEEDCIQTLEAVRRIMNDDMKVGAADFYIGSDIRMVRPPVSISRSSTVSTGTVCTDPNAGR